jgi:hypothetical protein
MTIDEMNRRMKAHEAELQQYIRRRLPLKVGAKSTKRFYACIPLT